MQVFNAYFKIIRKSLPQLLIYVAVFMTLAVLLTMAALPLTEMVFRKVAGRGLPGSIPVVQHLTLWITFLGAALERDQIGRAHV